jgi:putative glutamine amidotransferase
MPRVAIPTPTSFDPEYNRLNWPAYADAVKAAGGEAVEVKLDWSEHEVLELAGTCDAILLPGSPADVNPERFGQIPDPATAPADRLREATEEWLLQSSYSSRKPILGICFGAQFLNVWGGGTLVQDLTVLPVNHSASRGVLVAHSALIPGESLLGGLVDRQEATMEGEYFRLPVNSSHHQAVGIAGGRLRIVGRCPQDGVVEAFEGPETGSGGHFILGIQWHPERTTELSATSRAIFARLVLEAAAWRSRSLDGPGVRS